MELLHSADVVGFVDDVAAAADDVVAAVVGSGGADAAAAAAAFGGCGAWPSGCAGGDAADNADDSLLLCRVPARLDSYYGCCRAGCCRMLRQILCPGGCHLTRYSIGTRSQPVCACVSSCLANLPLGD